MARYYTLKRNYPSGEKVILKLNRDTVKSLLYSKAVQDELLKLGTEMTSRLGEGYEVRTTVRYGDRARAEVYASTEAAAQDTLENNSLIKAV